MTTPLFHLTLPPATDPSHLAPLQILLEWLAQVNEWHLRRSLRRSERGLSSTILPPLSASGVRYRRRPSDRQDWLDVPAVLQQRTGDEEDLVAWRCAELRVAGIPAEPVVVHEWRPGSGRSSGGWSVGCYVRHPDGRIEDPAANLGGSRRLPRPAQDRPLVHLSLPDSDDDAHFAPLQIALEGLTHLDEWQIRRARQLAAQGLTSPIPPLYASGIRYEEELPGHEDWLDALSALRQRRWVDCEDLAAYRCAELRADGIEAEPVIKYQWIPRELMIAQGYPADKLPARGVWLVHCCVRWPDGHVEDPSKILGMGGTFTERI